MSKRERSDDSPASPVGGGDALPNRHPAAEAVLDAIASTRAVRRYRDEPVPEADLATILFAASRAPSGSNRQGFGFVVLRDGPEALEARSLIGGAAREIWAAKRSADGYDRGSGSSPGSPKARMAATMEAFVRDFESIPVVTLATMRRTRPGPDETIGASVYPACQNFLLAARALGYGATMMTWHRLVEEDLRRVLGIPEDVLLAATITMGVPVGGQGPVRRKPLEEFVHDGRWGARAGWAADPPGTANTRWRR